MSNAQNLLLASYFSFSSQSLYLSFVASFFTMRTRCVCRLGQGSPGRGVWDGGGGGEWSEEAAVA